MNELEKIQYWFGVGGRLLTLGSLLIFASLAAGLTGTLLTMKDGCKVDPSFVSFFSTWLMVGLALAKFGTKVQCNAAARELEFYQKQIFDGFVAQLARAPDF